MSINPLIYLRTLYEGWAHSANRAPDDNRIRFVQEVLRLYGRSLRKRPDLTKKTVAEKFNSKRYARRKRSELARRIKRGSRVRVDRDVMAARYKQSPLLDAILPGRRDHWVLAPRRGGPVEELVVTKFNLIDHPRETLQALRSIAELECVAPDALMHFDDAFCTDIAPYLILAEMRPDLAPVFRGGRMSAPIQKVISAVGLDRALEMKLRVADTDDVWAFPLRRRQVARGSRVIQTSAPQLKEAVADDFCDALDVWLGQGANIQLTQSGRAAFATVMAELLDNAERHSAPTEGSELSGNWSCAAFMARRNEDGRMVYRCYMGFLSVGATIAESLRLGPAKMLADMNRYVNKHSFKGISAEALTSVYALQDGITRIHEAAGKRGGTGFQELLKIVRLLSDDEGIGSDARLTVISGNTCIQLKKPYVEGVKAEATNRRLLWFNDQNDPNRPPSRDHVFDLDHRIAGTVVGISFVLDHDYLKAKINDADQSSRADQSGPSSEPGRS